LLAWIISSKAPQARLYKTQIASLDFQKQQDFHRWRFIRKREVL
jgi:hypothetical protein